jgi:hypothetical protein
MHTLDGLPHLVSRGAQKNFAEFTLRLNARKGFVPDVAYFQELVARAILFRTAEKIVSRQEFWGYRAKIVIYTLAWIAHQAGAGVDLRQIWARQELEEDLSDLIEAACPGVHKLIMDSGGLNVTEGCKSEAYWAKIRDHDLWLQPHARRLLDRLCARAAEAASRNGTAAGDGQVVDRVVKLGAETWLAVSRWARETRSLEGWQRAVASGIARAISGKRRPSVKQATEGEKVLEEARRKGFNKFRASPASG